MFSTSHLTLLAIVFFSTATMEPFLPWTLSRSQLLLHNSSMVASCVITFFLIQDRSPRAPWSGLLLSSTWHIPVSWRFKGCLLSQDSGSKLVGMSSVLEHLYSRILLGSVVEYCHGQTSQGVLSNAGLGVKSARHELSTGMCWSKNIAWLNRKLWKE